MAQSSCQWLSSALALGVGIFTSDPPHGATNSRAEAHATAVSRSLLPATVGQSDDRNRILQPLHTPPYVTLDALSYSGKMWAMYPAVMGDE